MPQLDASTFASQIFWILVGFSLTYLFVSKFFTPKVEKVLSNRDLHVECILDEARALKSEADGIEKKSVVALAEVKAASIAAESELISSFKIQSSEEKKALSDLFAEKSKKESDLLIESSQKAFSNILDQMDDMVDAAATVLYSTGRKS